MAEAKFLDDISYEEKSFSELLLEKNLLTPDQLRQALLLKEKYKDQLGQILLKEGYLSSKDLYETLAEHLNTKYIDIKKHACDKFLLSEEDVFKYIEHKFIPWRKIGKVVCVAVVKLNDDLFLHLRKKYPNGFRIVLTTPQNIISNIQRKYSHITLAIVKKELRIVAPQYSSYRLFTVNQKVFLIFFSIFSFVIAITFSSIAVKAFLLIANLLFLINIIFKLVIFFKGMEKEAPDSSYRNVDESQLPIYTILLPLYKEGLVIKKLLGSMRNLNYPKSKLDIIIIVEQFDRKTIKALNKETYDGLFRIICVPKSDPQTKPKACSYALKFAEGEYVTIYDAEDRPEPDQLLKAVHMFKNSDKNVACLQSRLCCLNFRENLLAFLFSVEYLIWFGFFLKGLERLNIPIPLGGNSNHFKLSILKYIGGWDPYNVTEDADLGYRLAKGGYKTKMMNSVTWEEAPIKLKSWINQRSRWVKGNMQTYIVHLRDAKKLKDHFGMIGVFGFHAFLIIPILAYFLQLLILLGGFLAAEDGFLLFLKNLSIFNLVSWVILSIALAFFAISENKWKNVSIVSVCFYPFYYCLHFISAIIALYQLIFKTHYWAKTEHEFDDRVKNKT